ncbi:BHLH domain-containing protein [Caerostris darwini]|uniref:BHLH domain-containing protein n=1 Tax=Caerostris darwini TaxID=1538125 RepID=A0AAV4UIU3_9ARAC|nr:BHLH domain-containing protein [Caerostris darwini]
MYKVDLEYATSNLKSTEADESVSGVLVESNRQAASTTPLWLSHISASSRRRREVLLLKQRKEKLRRRRMVRRMEYQRLRNMVPSIAAKPLVSKVTVIEEAIRYIDYLHSALLTRLRTKGLPSCLRGANVDVNHLNLDDIKELVCQLVQRNNQLKKQQQGKGNSAQRQSGRDSPVSVYERSRRTPSYLTAKRPIRKRT